MPRDIRGQQRTAHDTSLHFAKGSFQVRGPIAVVAYSAVIHEPLEILDVPLVAAALDGFPNGSINVFDRDLRYVFAAGSGLTELGLSPKALVGRTLDELFDPALVAIVRRTTAARWRGARQFEFAAFGRTYHMSVAPVAATDGAIPHIVVVTQDITARKRREVAILDNEERLKGAEETLRALGRQKDVFISTLAHELRQPLGAMAAAVDVLKVRHPDIAASSPMPIIGRQLDQVTRLLDDLVDASRLMRGHVALSLEPLDVRGILQSALETVMPAMAQRDQQAIVTLAGTPLIVQGDRTRLQQVFSNLLNNAAKYGRAGGRVQVSAAREGGDITVTVGDDGVGIEAALLPHVFELFTQASTPDRGGIGQPWSAACRRARRHSRGERGPGAGANSPSVFPQNAQRSTRSTR